MDRSDRGAWGDALDEINRLRQQVADLRAALEEVQSVLIAVRDLPSADAYVREIAIVLDATQPQEVRS